jgi:hypothetical protein
LTINEPEPECEKLPQFRDLRLNLPFNFTMPSSTPAYDLNLPDELNGKVEFKNETISSIPGAALDGLEGSHLIKVS